MQISFEIMPNAFYEISSDNSKVITDVVGKRSPLYQIIEKNGFSKISKTKKIALIGEASFGKTTIIDDLCIQLMKKGEIYFRVSLFDFQKGKENIDDLLKKASGVKYALIDGLDEVDFAFREKAEDIIASIEKMSNLSYIIVASRYLPKKKLGGFRSDFLDEYEVITLEPLGKDKINALAEKLSIKSESFVYTLLSVPMYASMSMTIFAHYGAEIFNTITDEANYINVYFEALSFEKDKKFEIDRSGSYTWSNLYESAYDTLRNKSFSKTDIKIPAFLNTIVSILDNGEDTCYLKCSSIRFLNFFAAKYIIGEFVREHKKGRLDCITITSLLGFFFEADNLECLRFCGELLRCEPQCDSIIKALNTEELKQDTDWYFNLCLITFGYSQYINDNVFALGDCFAKIYSKRFGDNEKIKQIMSSSIQESKYYWLLSPVARALKEKRSIYLVTEEVHGVIFLGNNRNPREVIVDSKENITNVTIMPETKAIASGAFAHCMVKHIFISNSLEYIGQDAFYECLWLESVEFEKNSLCSFIGNGAFYCCISLKNIEIPEKITCISEGTFEFSGLENVKIPQSVISIDSSAFSATNLKSIDIPDGVVRIGSDAFSVCDSLESVSISESVISIGREAFFRCNNLQSIVIPISVNNIESGAFANCPAKIIITEGNENFTEIDGVIYNKSMTRIVYVSPSVKEMLIPKTITDIAHVFAHNNAIKNVRFEEGTKIISVGSNAFERCENLNSIKLPNSITTIDSFAFSECKNLMNIKIPASVMNIVDSAFTNCPAWLTVEEGNESFVEDKGVIYNKVKTKIIYISAGVEEILIPKTVTDIAYVFGHNKHIKSISFEEGSTLNNIPFYAFNSCENLSSLKLPNGITAIDRGAFCGCTSLTDLEVPASVTSIHAEAFKNCSAKVTIDARNKNFIIIDGVIYDKFLTKVISGSDSSEEIVIPKTVTDISFAFSQNYKLKNVCFEENSAITSVGDSAFLGCTSLANIKLPDSVISIGPDAFYGCTGLENIKISSNVTNIYAYAFSGCTGLTSITIPEGVTDIGECAFLKCSNLINIKLPSSLTSIGSNAFCDCSSLKNFDIPSGVNNIANYLFKNCVALESIVIPGCVTSIKLAAIDNCPNLKAIYYKGKRKRSESDSKKIGLATVFYFSEERPVNSGDYWHYVNGVPTVWE